MDGVAGLTRSGPHAATLKRVLFVWGRAAGVGGTETRMGEVSLRLRDMGHEVRSFSWNRRENSPLQRLLAETSSEVIVSKSAAKLRSLFRDFDPHIVVTFGHRASLLARVVAVGLPVADRMLMARNGLDHGVAQWLLTLERLTMRRGNLYLANSHAVAFHLRENGVRREQIRVLPSALAAEWSRPPVHRRDARSVGMVGNARIEKNQRLALQAFRASNCAGNLRVYTNDAALLRKEWARLLPQNDERSVTFVEGHRMEPADYDEISILLHPSTSESFPRVILEARARGCFVISGDVGDNREAVKGCGEVLDDFEVSTWSQALERAMDAENRGALPHNRKSFTSVEEYTDAFLDLTNNR